MILEISIHHSGQPGLLLLTDLQLLLGHRRLGHHHLDLLPALPLGLLLGLDHPIHLGLLMADQVASVILDLVALVVAMRSA